MRVGEIMTSDVHLISPDHTIKDAARLMHDADIGALPVGDHDRLVGMITDRDIAVRAIALGKGPDAKVRDVMTHDIRYCFADDDIDEVARNMGEQRVRRMPVVDRNKRLVGVLALGDVATLHDSLPAGEALERISQPGGAHSQTQDGGAGNRSFL